MSLVTQNPVSVCFYPVSVCFYPVSVCFWVVACQFLLRAAGHHGTLRMRFVTPPGG